MKFRQLKLIGLSGVFALGFSLNVFGQALPGPDPLQMEVAPDLGYIPVKHGLQIPHDVELGAATSVVWTEEDHLILFNRGPNPLMEFDPRGRLLRTWGQGEYLRPHGMRLDPQGNIWTTDVNGHTVSKMNLDGDVLLTIGTHGEAGEPEDGLLFEPTDLTINAEGEVFVLVGHGRGTPQLLKYDRQGNFMMKWGGPGTGPGQFDTPHSIVVDDEGLIYVADRQNRRIQIFDDEGTYLKEWHYKGLPCGLHFDEDGTLWMVSGFAGEILKLDENGKVVAATGEPGKGLGEFGEAHYMTIAPGGVIYVADTIKPDLHKFITRGTH
ncbi:MAG: peptidyl-alpha-hydroxyglycine alpha-amidating lyase family protein [Gammaproteobacteria bacterium]|nr:peptidyl-alpha-hydroxyglycine alpha-amidating lyase family protein [Gammaproteobacteria bacterium]